MLLCQDGRCVEPMCKLAQPELGGSGMCMEGIVPTRSSLNRGRDSEVVSSAADFDCLMFACRDCTWKGRHLGLGAEG